MIRLRMTALLLLKFIFGNLELKLYIFYQTLKVFLFFGHDFDFLLIVFLKLNTVEMTWYFLVYFLKQLLRLFKFEGHSFHLLGVFFVQLAFSLFIHGLDITLEDLFDLLQILLCHSRRLLVQLSFAKRTAEKFIQRYFRFIRLAEHRALLALIATIKFAVFKVF